MLDQLSDGTKDDLHLPAKKIRDKAAAIRDVDHVNTGHRHEQRAEEMRRGPIAGRGHIDFARIGFRVSDELRDSLGWYRWIYHHELGTNANARDRCNVADEIVIEVRVD